MAKTNVALPAAPTPAQTWARTPRPIPGRLGHIGPFDAEPFDNEDSFECALERAAQINRMARLMFRGSNLPDTNEDDDSKLLEHVLWAESLCLRRAIQLHNDRVPRPEEQPGVTPLRREGGA